MDELKYYMALPYSRRTEPVLDDDGSFYWLAWVEELDGCMTDGATEVEAYNNLNDAFDAYIQASLEWGDEIPLPERVSQVEESPDLGDLQEISSSIMDQSPNSGEVVIRHLSGETKEPGPSAPETEPVLQVSEQDWSDEPVVSTAGVGEDAGMPLRVLS